VLTDIHLAGRLDGWDLLIALKDDPLLRTIPVLIISASTEANNRALALAGADYLLKPISSEWLMHAIEQRLPSVSGKRVLVVDDDMVFRHQVSAWLATEGIVVEDAANGQEALTYLTHSLPDLLLLDLLLPEIDGFEVLRQLRANRRTMNLPVLIVTGKDLSADEKVDIIRNKLKWVGA
jgi:CheY-like chemotaxis protein